MLLFKTKNSEKSKIKFFFFYSELHIKHFFPHFGNKLQAFFHIFITKKWKSISSLQYYWMTNFFSILWHLLFFLTMKLYDKYCYIVSKNQNPEVGFLTSFLFSRQGSRFLKQDINTRKKRSSILCLETLILVRFLELKYSHVFHVF